jgi:hypothetical protein
MTISLKIVLSDLIPANSTQQLRISKNVEVKTNSTHVSSGRRHHKKRRHRKNRKKAQSTSYSLSDPIKNGKEISFIREMAPNDDLFIEPAGDFDLVYGDLNNT